MVQNPILNAWKRLLLIGLICCVSFVAVVRVWAETAVITLAINYFFINRATCGGVTTAYSNEVGEFDFALVPGS